MATSPAIHTIDRAAEALPASAAHRVLAILAGDVVPGPSGDAADGVARCIIGLGWGGLSPDTLAAAAVGGPAPWFVRVTFPGIAPPDPFIVDIATAAGLRVESLAQAPASAPAGTHTRWLLVAPQSRDAVSSAVAHLLATHRIHAVPFRKIEDR